ncbi:MAG: NB-ARC domain-containing protein [Anaerolineae bacterium]|nr:NB-ARC domain-containing protein [Anaerolineae bacterium]
MKSDQKVTNLSDTPFSRNQVRAALKLWHTAHQLGEHALASQPFVDPHGKDGRGLVLREVLRRGIEALRPGGTPDFGDKHWRPYLILTEQFIAQRKPEVIAGQLGLVRGSFHHEQAHALDLLAGWLADLAQTTPPASPTPTLAPLHIAPPRPPHPLIGRHALYAELKRQLRQHAQHGCVALYGLPGVGKTALALELANDADLIQHFKDGVLWAGVGSQPDLLAILGTWANALGLSPDDIGRLNTVAARRNAIRAVIGLRHMLLICDDIWQLDIAQALQLGGPNCAHVITTRLPNVALAFAENGACGVGELGTNESAALLAHHAPQVVQDHAAAIQQIIQHMGGLPLALSLVGRQLRKASASNVPRRVQQALTAWLTPTPASPQPAASSETTQALHEAIRSSYEALPADAREALLALAVFPPKPNRFAEEAALAVGNCRLHTLDLLLDDGLLEAQAGRYSLHQSIANFAHSQADPHAATARFVAHYSALAQTHTDDFGLLDAELVNLMAALTHSHALAWPVPVLQGIHALYPYLEARGLLDQAEQLLAQADLALGKWGAEAEQRPILQARTLRQRGQLARRRGQFDLAEPHYAAALALLKAAAGSPACADESPHLLLHMATLANDRGDREQAEMLGQQALAQARLLKQPSLLINILTQLAAAAGFRGKFDETKAHLNEAMNLAQSLPDTRHSAFLHLGLGFLASWTGDVPEAERQFEQTVAFAKQHEQREIASIARALQGWVATNLGDYDRAIALSNEGLALIREGSFCESVGLLYANLGLVAFSRGQDAEGEAWNNKGLAAVRQIKHVEGECLLLGNMARQLFELGQLDEAERLSHVALKIADDVGFWDLMSPLLTTLGEIVNSRGDYDDADGLLMMALALGQQMQRPWLMVYGQLIWGQCFIVRSAFDKAYAAFYEARQIAEQLGSRSFGAVALFGLARVARAAHNETEAMQLAEQAHRDFQRIGHNYAGRVEAFIASGRRHPRL